MEEAYTDPADRATGNVPEDGRARKAQQARERRARKARRKEAVETLNAMKELRIRRLVARAERSEKVRTKDGQMRAYRFRGNVAAMACRLLFWEGKGEVPGCWVFKSAAEWEAETGLTERQQRTARRVARDERLWREKEHTRRDGRTVVAYRLDAWRLWQIVNRAELAIAKEKLKHAHDPAKKAEARREIRELERTRDTLVLGDSPGVYTEVTSEEPPTREENDRPNRETQSQESDTPANMSVDPLHNGEHAGEYFRGFRLSSDTSGGDEAVAPSSSTASSQSHQEEESAEIVEGIEGGVEAYGNLYRQVEAILRGDCQSERAREVLGSLVEGNLRGDPYAVGPGVIAKLVRGFVRTRPADNEADLTGIVEEVLAEMRPDDLATLLDGAARRDAEISEEDR